MKEMVPFRTKKFEPVRAQDIKARPPEFQSLAGVGQLDNTSWAKIPTYYYDVTQVRGPMLEAEFAGSFGGTVPLFNETQQQPGRQTNAETGSGVNEPFLALGVGVVAIAEGLSFTLPGALLPVTAGEDCIPQVDGCVADEANRANAALWWGGAWWDFIERFFQRYRLQMLVNRRFELVNEALFDVGMVPVPPEFVGASSSLVPGMRFVREVNDVMVDKGIDYSFLPQNLAGTLCVGAPTAAVTYGHPRIIGLANRMYCFNQPIPIFPGMRFDVNFTPVENDLAVGGFLDGMRRDVVLTPGTPTRPDSRYDSDTICNTGITASAYTVAGGTLSIGLVFKGYALQPRACVEYITQYMLPSGAMWQMLSGIGQTASFLHGLLPNVPDTYEARLSGGKVEQRNTGRSTLAGWLGDLRSGASRE